MTATITTKALTDWTVEDTVAWMIAEQEASTGLSEIQGSVFKAQAYATYTQGVKEYWGALEKAWKEKTNDAPLPGKYRSSKSVLKSAIALGIDVRDKGKTEIEKEIKAKRAEAAASTVGICDPGGAEPTRTAVPKAGRSTGPVTEDEWYAHIVGQITDAYTLLSRESYLSLVARLKGVM